jgi:hypothetical protein
MTAKTRMTARSFWLALDALLIVLILVAVGFSYQREEERNKENEFEKRKDWCAEKNGSRVIFLAPEGSAAAKRCILDEIGITGGARSISLYKTVDQLKELGPLLHAPGRYKLIFVLNASDEASFKQGIDYVALVMRKIQNPEFRPGFIFTHVNGYGTVDVETDPIVITRETLNPILQDKLVKQVKELHRIPRVTGSKALLMPDPCSKPLYEWKLHVYTFVEDTGTWNCLGPNQLEFN